MIVKAITVSRKKVMDRYTLYFYDGSCLTMSSRPDSPQGVSQWGQYFGVTDADIETGSFNDEEVINWFDLPVIVQAHAEQRIREAGQS